ncbi:unnamed protein product [Linum trigynum]|uniref:Uncharacterized protein n=1 Tax=Linum trigynum TaxID=586398 RepID=A0AAV2GGG6_9ROSI
MGFGCGLLGQSEWVERRLGLRSWADRDRWDERTRRTKRPERAEWARRARRAKGPGKLGTGAGSGESRLWPPSLGERSRGLGDPS